MDNKSLQEIIRKERKKQKISPLKVYKETHLPKKFINLMENGQWEDFPSKLHLKGYLKIYLKYLNLDTELVEQYKEEIFPEEGVCKKSVEENVRKKTNDFFENKKKYLAIILPILFFLIVILFFKILP